MKLVTFEYQNEERVGVLSEDEKRVIELGVDSMNDLIRLDEKELSGIKESKRQMELSEVRLLAPIPRPLQDVICVGTNYRDHLAESEEFLGDSAPADNAETVYFDKRVSEAVAPGGTIEAHEDIDECLDYEVELGVVIGKDARYVKAEDAYDYVFGYTIVNDVSARTCQISHQQFFFGKSFDDFTPIGPWIVTEEEFERPPRLKITSSVNGELRQNSNTEQLIRDVPFLIEELSSVMTLRAGTIIATGTPAGVGLGFDPPKYMKPGDVIRCEIEGIGVLENTVISSAEKWGR